jgi:hypothetical protein
MAMNGRAGAGGGERLPVVIRAMGARDVPGLLRMRGGGLRLALPESQVSGYTPLRGLVQGRWNPLRGERVRTYVAAANREPVAFLQARERTPRQRHRWDILYVGATRGEAGATPERRAELWTALLDYTTAAAGRRGVQRLYAKTPERSEVAEAFRSAGYVRYGEETLYLLYGQHGDGSEAEPEANAPRPQAPGDTWALHQLYTLTAPKPVQFAEALTSYRWEVPGTPLLPLGSRPRESGLIVDHAGHEHEIAIYCRVGQLGRRAWLEFVFAPSARDELEPTIGAILRSLSPGPGERIYCAVREFQHELGGALEAHGFEAIGVQDLLVRYTTVTARAPALRLVRRPLRERGLVGVPAQGTLRREGPGRALPPSANFPA